MKLKCYVYAQWGDRYDSKRNEIIKQFTFQVWPYRADSWGTFVCVHEFEVPDVDENALKMGHITILRGLQQKARADCEVQVQDYEQQIQEMLCLSAPVDAPAKVES